MRRSLLNARNRCHQLIAVSIVNLELVPKTTQTRKSRGSSRLEGYSTRHVTICETLTFHAKIRAWIVTVVGIHVQISKAHGVGPALVGVTMNG